MALVSGCAGGITAAYKKDATQAPPVVVKPLAVTPPDWVLGRGHPKYPLSQYIVGVGISDKSSVSANESSRSELAKSLKVKIKSKIKDYSDNEGTLVQRLIETEVNTILEGVEIKDGWYDSSKKVYYSFTALDRSLAAAGILGRIKEIESLHGKHLREGSEAEERGDVTGALSHYLSSYHNTSGLPSLQSALRVITREAQPVHLSDTQRIPGNTALERINSITQNLRLNTVSGDNQVVKTYKGISEPLVVEVYLEKTGRKIPLSNIPVVFRFEKGGGQMDFEKVSDANGRVQTTIHKIDSFDETNHVIAAKLNYQTLTSNLGPSSKDLLSPLKHMKVFFNYSIDTPKWASDKSQVWKRGITNLVNQIIQNIPPGGNPKVGVIGFKDLRHDTITPFNEILKEDFETVLVQAQNLTVKETIKPKEKNHEETAKEQALDFYINGSYRLENRGLEIRARLVETRTRHILSSGDISIEKSEINAEDLVFLTGEGRNPSSPAEVYAENLETLIASKPEITTFNIKVWTNKDEDDLSNAIDELAAIKSQLYALESGMSERDAFGKPQAEKIRELRNKMQVLLEDRGKRNEYQVGEKVIFHVKSDRDAYLTLLDISSNGDVTVIFPNAYHEDNFLRGERTYQIPTQVYGPAGLERIKAVATLERGTPIDFDFSRGFHRIKHGDPRSTRDIKALANEFSAKKRSGWAEASSEIYIFEKGKTYYRGSRKVPIVKQPEKPKDILGTLGRDSEIEE
mgnify:CR=1 FL=1